MRELRASWLRSRVEMRHDCWCRRVMYLHNILPVFVLPVGITLLLVLAGLRLRRGALIWTGSCTI